MQQSRRAVTVALVLYFAIMVAYILFLREHFSDLPPKSSDISVNVK